MCKEKMKNILSNHEKTRVLSDANKTVHNFENVYKSIVSKFKKAPKRKRSKVAKTTSGKSTSSSPSPKISKSKQKTNVNSRKSSQKSFKAAQPYKLRKAPEAGDGFKKVLAFGSFAQIPEMPKRKIIQRGPDWRTRLMLSTLMKNNSMSISTSTTAASSLTSRTNSKMIIRKSSFMKKPPTGNPPDEVAALSYIQAKPKLFVPCRSASKSFNLKLNLQELAAKRSEMKHLTEGTRLMEVPTKVDVCPAMQSKSVAEFPINRNDVWATPFLTTRCTCYPGKHEKRPILPAITSFRFKSSQSQGAFIDTFVDKLQNDWKAMSFQVDSIFNSECTTNEKKEHLGKLLPLIQKREQQLEPIESVMKEIKSTKMRLISLNTKNMTQRHSDGLKLVLKKIHSAL